MTNLMRGHMLLVCSGVFGTLMLTGSVYAFVDDNGERKVSLEDAPEAIRNALRGIDVNEVEVEMEDGAEVYEVEFRVDDDEVELKLTADSRLLGVEIEHEEGGDCDSETTMKMRTESVRVRWRMPPKPSGMPCAGSMSTKWKSRWRMGPRLRG